MSAMTSKLLEIERKYRTQKDDWDAFVSLCRSLKPSTELEIGGPDTYFEKDDSILRWRYGLDISELTVKSRYSRNSSLIRQEVEIDVSENSAKEVLNFIKSMGFKKLFRIHKTCHIFWFKDDLGEVCAVIYKVFSKTHKPKYFIEIEAEKGLSVEVSKKLIRDWELKLKLSPSRRLNSTLFEIYSGQLTKLMENQYA